MKKIQKIVQNIVAKYGGMLVGCAFMFVAIAANSSCVVPFYEPEEPEGIEAFKNQIK